MASAADAREDLDDAFATDFASEKEPVHFSGERFTYSLRTRVIKGSGDVEVVQGDTTLRGDRLTIDLSTGVAEIEGDVEVTRPGGRITGDRGVYDFEKEQGVFYNARGDSAPWYVGAEKIERESGGQYRVEDSWFSTCDLADPHYRLASKNTTVIPGDRIVARDIVLRVGSLPVFYLPYYSHRLDTGRPPLEWKAGSDGDVGVYARLGYNLEIGEEILLTPHVWGFTKSGVGGGLNGRLNLFGGAGRGEFESFYISDRNEDNTDDPRIDRDRGIVDFYYRQEMPHDLTALFQAEYITDSEFLKTFDFDDYSERELPESFVNLERTAGHHVLSLTVRERLVDYIQDVDRLPELRAELLEQRVLDTGLFFSATNEIAYLDDEEGDFHVTRDFAAARIRRPTRLWRWLELVPFVEGDATYYSRTLTEEDEGRLSWSGGLVGQTKFHKVYGSPLGRFSAFRHLVTPTVTYRFRPTPDEEPAELYEFDAIDTIDRENSLELEIRNYLQAKKPDGEIVDFAQYHFTAGVEFDDGEDKLATLENEVLLRPAPDWELAFKAVDDFRDGSRSDFLSGVLRYTRAESFGASLGFVHEDTLEKPHDTQAIYSLSKALGSLWRVGLEQHYSVNEDDFTYQEVWVWRDLHCWEALLRLRDRRESTSVMFLINIKAFPMRRIERKIALDPIGEDHPWPTRW